MKRHKKSSQSCRHLAVVLGDQLDFSSGVLKDFDPNHDVVWMAEVQEEATQVWSHKARIAMFLAAMRHFRDGLERRKMRIDYHALEETNGSSSFKRVLRRSLLHHKPVRVIVQEPGEWRVREALREAVAGQGIELEIRPDRHFYCSTEDFARHAESRRQLRMEYFYRELRKREGILMDPAGKPCGGVWNFDRENRESFGSAGPRGLPELAAFAPDQITRQVLREVERRFPGHPGSLDRFDWPVNREQALRALQDFVEHRLPHFGSYQDAMWAGEPFLYHARISNALNLKLLNPREVCAAAEQAWREGRVKLPSAEGFIRQVLGWREYVRGIYWRYMPDYLQRNELDARHDLPSFYWNAQTEMNCLRETIGQVLGTGYAHHIQRLMVSGLYALLLGVHPRQVHEWYLAMFVDAVEWVELPNSLGMSQYADGGLMASKPYVASGKYIHRMSNYCAGCRFDPNQSTGPEACPFTTLYWDFLIRHESRFARHPRMRMQLRNLKRLSRGDKLTIQRAADQRRAAPA